MLTLGIEQGKEIRLSVADRNNTGLAAIAGSGHGRHRVKVQAQDTKRKTGLGHRQRGMQVKTKAAHACPLVTNHL